MKNRSLADPLRIGIIGYGYWGGNYVRVFSELPGSRVVGVCDRRTERLTDLRAKWPDIAVTAEADELLERRDIDAIVVCTEATSHYAIAIEALRSGKHVLIEKPITTEVGQACELSAYAASLELTLMVGHTFIFNAGVRKLKQYVDERPNDIYYLHACRTNLGPIRRDVNALWDLATHDIAIFSYLLGTSPEWVSAAAAKVLRNGREDVGFITLGYRDNVLGHIHVSWADPNKAREVTVVTSDRRIVFNDLSGTEPIRVFNKGIRPEVSEPMTYGEYRLQVRDGDIVSPKIDTSEPLKSQCAHFLECVRNGSRPLTSGWDGAEVVSVLEAMNRSVGFCGAKVEVQKLASQTDIATLTRAAR